MSISINVSSSTGGEITVGDSSAPNISLDVTGGVGPSGAGDLTLAAGTGISIVQSSGTATISSTVTGSGNLALNDLTNVNASSPSQGQILEYNGTQWVAASSDTGSNVTSLGTLSDVTLSSTSSGQFLSYNGTAWTAVDAPSGGGTSDLALSTSVPGADLGTSGVGSSGRAARADHVHDMPTLGDVLSKSDVVTGDVSLTSTSNFSITAQGNSFVVSSGQSELTVAGGSSGSGSLTLNCEQNSHGVTIKGPAHSASATYTLTLPDDVGSANQLLTTDGTGGLSWSTPEAASGFVSWTTTAPTTSNTTGSGGDIAYDASGFYYVHTGTSWVRTQLEEFGVSTPVISIDQQPENATINQNGNGQFSVSASVTGGALLTFQWEKSTNNGASWSTLAGFTSSVLSLTGVSINQDGTYYRVIVSSAGATSVTSNSAILTVGEGNGIVTETNDLILTESNDILRFDESTVEAGTITITSQSTSASLSASGEATFTVDGTASNGATVRFQWQEAISISSTFTNIGDTVTGYNSPELNLTNTTSAKDGYAYRCVLSANGCDDATSTPVILSASAVLGREGSRITSVTAADFIGRTTAVNEDGTRVVVGGDKFCRVYEYNSTSDTWDQKGNDLRNFAEGSTSTEKLDFGVNGFFASMSDDGLTVAIGDRNWNNGSAGSTDRSGAVVVLEYNSTSDEWDEKGDANDIHLATVYAQDSTLGVGAAGGGWTVHLSGDGDTVYIGGDPNEIVGRNEGARVFHYDSSTTTWKPRFTSANDLQATYFHGIDSYDISGLSYYQSVSATSENMMTLVTSDSTDGKVFVADYQGDYDDTDMTNFGYNQASGGYKGQVLSPVAGQESRTDINGYYGKSVDLSSDGLVLSVGVYRGYAPGETAAGDSTECKPGAVVVYERDAVGDDFTRRELLNGTVCHTSQYGGTSTPISQRYFGARACLNEDGKILVVGSDYGALWLFEWNGSQYEQLGGIVTPGTLEGFSDAELDEEYNSQWSEFFNLSKDGSTIVLGDSLFDIGSLVYNVGAVDVLKLNRSVAITTQPASSLTVFDGQIQPTVEATVSTGTVIKFLWQVKASGTSTFVDTSYTTKNPTITGLTNSNNGDVYRCVVSAAGATSVTSNEVTVVASSWTARGGNIWDTAQPLVTGSLLSPCGLSDDGSRIIVGAPGQNTYAGHAQVLEYDSSTDAWSRLGQVLDTGESQFTFAGKDVSISSDGNRVLVSGGIDTNFLTDNLQRNRRYMVFDYNSTSDAWTAKFTWLSSRYLDIREIKMSRDGKYLFMSVYRTGSSNDLYVVKVSELGTTAQTTEIPRNYMRTQDASGNADGLGTTYGLTQSLSISDEYTEGDDKFVNVAFGNFYGDDTSYGQEGRVRVFKVNVNNYTESTSGGSTLITTTMEGLKVTNHSYFGTDIALDKTGKWLAVGAPGTFDGGAAVSSSLDISEGAVYVYQLTGTSTWQQRGLPFGLSRTGGSISGIADSYKGSGSGTSLDISGDGSKVIVGAPYRTGPTEVKSGAVKVFEYDSVNQEWDAVITTLVGDDAEQQFGLHVAISGDGEVIAVGAPRDDAVNTNAGSVKSYSGS